MSRPSQLPEDPSRRQDSGSTRRGFIKTTTAGIVGGSLAATLGSARRAHAAGDDLLRVGLIGCGGRGSGAALNAMRADPNVRIVALADVFDDRLQHARRILETKAKSDPSMRDKFDVPPERCHTGFDGYKQVIDSDVDVVLLCTPPHFRPMHLRAAVDAGKHVFCEKPVAVDPTGVRSVLETTESAREKGLTLVSGLCWRYDYAVKETMNRILDGEIGDVMAIQENYLTGTLWHRGRKPEWSEMEYQMRNWMYFTWLSGDHICEQHVHSLDKALWLMGDQPPKVCYGLGGRQVRTGTEWGHIYDHFAVCFEWPNGVKAFAYTRQMNGCLNDVDDYVLGTQGKAEVLRNVIEGPKGRWRYRGDKPSMYDVEHVEMFAAIRKGEPINNGKYMSYSTLMAIMCREACYTGEQITLEQAMASTMDLSPSAYEWDDVETPEVAVPGVTKFV